MSFEATAFHFALELAKLVPVPGVATAATVLEDAQPALEKLMPIAQAAVPALAELAKAVAAHVSLGGLSLTDALARVHGDVSTLIPQAEIDRQASQG